MVLQANKIVESIFKGQQDMPRDEVSTRDSLATNIVSQGA